MYISNRNIQNILLGTDVLDRIETYTFESFKNLIQQRFKKSQDYIIAQAFERNSKGEEKAYFFDTKMLNKCLLIVDKEIFHKYRNRRQFLNPINNFYPIIRIYYYAIKYKFYGKVQGEYKAYFIGSYNDLLYSRELRNYIKVNTDD